MAEKIRILVKVPLARTYELVLYVEINYCQQKNLLSHLFSQGAGQAKGVRVGEKVPRDERREGKPKIS